jgi:putative ABC transport system permease protein
VETYGLRLVAGRGFSKETGTDHLAAFVLNETAVRALGWGLPSAAVGRAFAFDGKEGRVIGVVADYHFAALYQPIGALVLDVSPATFQTFSLRVRVDDGGETLRAVEALWRRFFPDRVFDYTFLDDQFDRLYRQDQRMGRIVGYLTVLALSIACLGLFGLAAYVAQQRTKEIGIRKVLGASAAGIVVLLARDFVVLVAVAFVLAAPLAWLALRQWLSGFAYHVDLSAAVFLLAGAAALVVALATVAYQSFRAASADPVRSLRYE